MNFTVQGKEFLNQLNASAKVLNSKNSNGMLDNFLLTLEGGKLYITSSDSENVLTSGIEVLESEGEGSVVVAAKRLIELVKEISNQPISITVNENYLINIEYLNGNFNFMGMNPSPFPLPAPLAADAKKMVIPSSVIKAGLSQTLFAVSVDIVRPIMTGILWDIFPDKIVFVSSDTHKLVRYENRNFAPKEEFSFVLHSKTAKVINSLLGEEEEQVEIHLNDNSAVFKFGEYEMNCRFLKGRFPQYNRVIPKDNPYEVVVDRQSMISAVRRVAICASTGSNLVKLGLDENGMKLATQDFDYSLQASEQVMCEYTGVPMSIGFDTRHTAEILSNLSDETIIMKLSDSARPALFVPQKDKEGENVVMLQMPLTVID